MNGLGLALLLLTIGAVGGFVLGVRVCNFVYDINEDPYEPDDEPADGQPGK